MEVLCRMRANFDVSGFGSAAIIAILLAVVVLSSGCTQYLQMLPEAEPCGEGGKCREGFACDTDGRCHVCGNADGRVCCEGFKCEEGFVCKGKHCAECGSHWKPCCEGNYCNEGCECVEGETCRCCGWIGEACCEGSVCNEGGFCGDDGMCHRCLSPDDTKESGMACVSRG